MTTTRRKPVTKTCAIATLLVTAAHAAEPYLEIAIVPSPARPDQGDFVVSPCDGSWNMILIWARAVDGPVEVGSWTFDFAGSGAAVVVDCAFSPPMVNRSFSGIPGSSTDNDCADGLVAWDRGTGWTLTFQPEAWYWWLYLFVSLDDACERDGDTKLQAGGVAFEIRDRAGELIEVRGATYRDLAPACYEPDTVCPARRPYCTADYTCAASHPARLGTCGECEAVEDCARGETCVCGSCEFEGTRLRRREVK